jgi:hypothetical protein
VTNPGFHDPDQDAGNDWTVTVGASAVTWTAPTDAAAQDYDSLFNFRFNVNASPTAASGTVVKMKVQEAKIWTLSEAIVGPGTPTAPRR